MATMHDYTGWIVQATAGRDKGGLFCVIGVDRESGRLLLADGKGRKVSHPKRKKLGHVRCLTSEQAMYEHPVIRSLREGTMPSDPALRRALAAFRAESRRV